MKELPSHHGTDTSTTFRCRLQAIDVADRLANSCKIGQERALTQAIRKLRLLGSPLEINKNVDRGVIERAGFRAIHWAAYYGNDKAIEILSKAPGFDPNIENSGGYTPLHSAIGNLRNNIPRLVTTVNALLKAKADANRTNSSCCILWTKSCTPLHYAIWHLRNNGEQIIKSLIRNGADPEQQYGGQTAIEYADYYGLSSQIREAITAR